jgi:hypothetical protein
LYFMECLTNKQKGYQMVFILRPRTELMRLELLMQITSESL